MIESGGETKRWFYVREGRRLGPVETGRLVDLVLSGEVPEDALVWHAGLPEWLKARDADEIRRELPPPVPVSRPPRPPEAAVPGEPGVAGDAAGEGGGAPGPGDEVGLSEERRRRKRKRRHRDSKRPPAWLWPLVGVLVALMIFLWWLLRRMNEVPPGRIIQTGLLFPPPTGDAVAPPYRVALGREPRVSSSVTSCPDRFTTTATLSPGFASPRA